MGSNDVISFGVASLGLHHPQRKTWPLLFSWRYLDWEGSLARPLNGKVLVDSVLETFFWCIFTLPRDGCNGVQHYVLQYVELVFQCTGM